MKRENTSLSVDPEEIAELVAFASELADLARGETLPRFRAAITIEDKGEHGFDPVTEGDRAAERAMRNHIVRHFPEHGIEGEEYPARQAQGPWSWTLDPIDGTRAFIAGIPLWGILVALSFERRPVIGLIDQPYLDERYLGFPGGSEAMIRGKLSSLQTRRCENLAEATLMSTDPNLFDATELGAFDHVRRQCRLTRYGTDCYAYALLAAGHADLVIEAGLKPCDVRALIPVVEGAGGVVSNWRGGSAVDGGQVLASGSRELHAEVLAGLRRANPGS